MLDSEKIRRQYTQRCAEATGTPDQFAAQERIVREMCAEFGLTPLSLIGIVDPEQRERIREVKPDVATLNCVITRLKRAQCNT